MATSGTTAFALDFTELAEEAWEQAGRQMRSGYDYQTAVRSFNLMSIEWQNRGINLWTIDTGSVPLTSGTATYALPADTIDLLEQFIRQGNQDLTIARIMFADYSNIPNKTTTGRPSQFFIDRAVANPSITVWPVPSSDDYTFHYYRMRRIEDAGQGYNTPDFNFRFYPAAAAGLAYHIAKKTPELLSRLEMLKDSYEEQFRIASEEDRDKTSLRIVPRRRGW